MATEKYGGNLRRQIETVFSSMINEMTSAVPEMEVYTIDEPNRRSQGGQYHANDLIELYLSFGGRKEKVDTKELDEGFVDWVVQKAQS